MSFLVVDFVSLSHFVCILLVYFFFFFKQKTAYEMRISDWSSDVCSSDLIVHAPRHPSYCTKTGSGACTMSPVSAGGIAICPATTSSTRPRATACTGTGTAPSPSTLPRTRRTPWHAPSSSKRSEEHTSELQSLMRISYAVFCLKTKNTKKHNTHKQ